MLGQRLVDGVGIAARARHLLEVLGREAAAEVHHLQCDAARLHGIEDRLRLFQCGIPGGEPGLLRADVEGDAIGLEAKLVGVHQHVHRHGGLAAELARQGPLSTGAIGEDAAEHLGGRRRTGDLLHFLVRIDGEQLHAEGVGARDVALLLDGVAKRDALRGGTRGERHLDLDDRGGVEARAHVGQHLQDLRRRVGLHRIEDAGVGHGAAEGAEVVGNDFKVDDEARTLGTSVTQEVENAGGGSHVGISPNQR